MLPEMARHLYEAGFKTKESFYEWMYKKSFMTVGQYRTHSWPDVNTNAWKRIEKTSGKHWKELPDDYMVPAMTDPYRLHASSSPAAAKKCPCGLPGGAAAFDPAYSIDAWR